MKDTLDSKLPLHFVYVKFTIASIKKKFGSTDLNTLTVLVPYFQV